MFQIKDFGFLLVKIFFLGLCQVRSNSLIRTDNPERKSVGEHSPMPPIWNLEGLVRCVRFLEECRGVRM